MGSRSIGGYSAKLIFRGVGAVAECLRSLATETTPRLTHRLPCRRVRRGSHADFLDFADLARY